MLVIFLFLPREEERVWLRPLTSALHPIAKWGGHTSPVSGWVSDSAQGTPSPCPAPQTGRGPSKGLIRGERPLFLFPSSFQDSQGLGIREALIHR